MLRPRTGIAFLLYGTFCYLCITGEIEPDAIIAVVSSLMTFYYTERRGKYEAMVDRKKPGGPIQDRPEK